MKRNGKLKVIMALVSAACTFSGALANEDAILNSDPIDINGYVKEAPATDHELETVKNELRKQKQAIQVNKEKGRKYKELSRTTEKLADVTEDLIDERTESQKTIDRYNKKIDCMMNKDTTDPECDEYVRRDEVKISQAAPKSQANIEEPNTSPLQNKIKVLPYTGFTQINSENEDLEAGIAGGLRVESDVLSNLSVGLGISYTSLETTDFANAYKGYQYSTWDGRYDSAYAGGRQVEYSNIGFELYGKYYITKTERFRPYAGAGVSYNRSSMNYLQNTNKQYSYGYGQQQQQFRTGDEEVISSHIKGTLIGGSEIVFTKSIGMNLELSYARGFGSNLSSENRTVGPDQRRLEQFNNELISANIFGVYAGMLIMF